MSGFDVALTFDAEHPDGPRCPAGVAERIVSVLDANSITASFFLQGRWATAYPDLARQIADGGHAVGSHSHAHARLANFSPTGLVADIRAAEEAIAASAGVDPHPWFRCPHGTHSHGEHLAPALRELAYHDAHWNVTARDWEADASAADIADRVIDGIETHREGAVVLLHSWPAGVPEALARIIDHVGERGGRFVTIAEMAPNSSWLESTVDGQVPNGALAPGRDAV
ncbi:MAG TPA: polysaccharide deacetylase family protein [Micromonosporaceae bacterium]|jgi:peptidoglycan/xylan/chitin deacetylase (PgdA/CDA1 family)